jgi:hypothetical protein
MMQELRLFSDVNITFTSLIIPIYAVQLIMAFPMVVNLVKLIASQNILILSLRHGSSISIQLLGQERYIKYINISNMPMNTIRINLFKAS